MPIIAIAIYVFGVVLHTKVIMVSKKDKDLTWKIDIANSIFVLSGFASLIIIYTLTDLMPNLYMYTGEWFCYVCKVISHYTMLYLSGHSMVISMMKYFIIVYDENVRNLKDRLKIGFFWLNIFHPILNIVLQTTLNPDYIFQYDGYPRINKCLGNLNLTKITWYSMCEFNKPLEKTSVEYAIYIFKWSICTGQVVLMLSITLNLFDMFFYHRIFSYMKR